MSNKVNREKAALQKENKDNVNTYANAVIKT